MTQKENDMGLKDIPPGFINSDAWLSGDPVPHPAEEPRKGTPRVMPAGTVYRFINSDGRVFEEVDDGKPHVPPDAWGWVAFDEDVLLIVHSEPDGLTFHTVPHPYGFEGMSIMLDHTLSRSESWKLARAILEADTEEVRAARAGWRR